MSWQATTWVSGEVRGISPAERMVLLTMSNYADPDGRGIFPGRDRLADEVELSVRQIQRLLAQLEAKGLIERGDQELARVALRGRRGEVPRRLPVVWNLSMGRSKVAALEADRPPIGTETFDDNEDVNDTDDVETWAQTHPETTQELHAMTSQGPHAGSTFVQVRERDNMSPSVTSGNVTALRGPGGAVGPVKRGHERGPKEDRKPVLKRTSDVPYNNHSTTSKQPPTPASGPRAGRVGPGGPTVVVVDSPDLTSRPARSEPGRVGSPPGATDGRRGRPEPAGERVAVPSPTAVAALAMAVSRSLPIRLRQGIGAGILRKVCGPLVLAGVAPEPLGRAVADHSWDGARAGAVIEWLRTSAVLAVQPDPANADVVPVRGPWCGQCDDERTRLVAVEDGKVRHCPDCHPKRRTVGDSAGAL